MDDIYLVDPATKALTRVRPVSLAEIGLRERQDLEEWVRDHPEILGEELLTISTEYSGFDRSNRRLDVLMLDRNGLLVVVELKLALDRTFADQQAIRYAAFCETMTMDHLVTELAHSGECSQEEASARICEFLNKEELPKLDQELTGTVLWLRKFGVDITCVELRPYKVVEENRLILVPRTIIPLPQTRNYVVGVEQKAVRERQVSKPWGRNAALWRAVADEFNALGTGFRSSGRARGSSCWSGSGTHTSTTNGFGGRRTPDSMCPCTSSGRTWSGTCDALSVCGRRNARSAKEWTWHSRLASTARDGPRHASESRTMRRRLMPKSRPSPPAR